MKAELHPDRTYGIILSVVADKDRNCADSIVTDVADQLKMSFDLRHHLGLYLAANHGKRVAIRVIAEFGSEQDRPNFDTLYDRPITSSTIDVAGFAWDAELFKTQEPLQSYSEFVTSLYTKGLS